MPSTTATTYLSTSFITCSSFDIQRALLLLTLTVLYLIYEKILRPPPSLRHIPHLNFFTSLIALATRKSLDQLTKDINGSDVVQGSTNGIYLRRDYVGWTVRITRPEDAKILMARKDLFPKSVKSVAARRGTLAGRILFGLNIIFTAGDDYKRQRKVIHPALHRAMPMKLFSTLSQKAVDGIEAGVPIDVHLDLSHPWSMKIMMANIFGHDLGDKSTEWISRFERIRTVAQNALYFTLPFIDRNFKHLIPGLRKAHQEMTIYADMINEIVRKKREAVMRDIKDTDDHDKDLLTLMIEASMRGKEHFSDEDFQANVLVLFLAGHDTTASSLSCALYYLATHQNYQERARDEVICAFGDGHNIHPTYDDTQNLPYVTMVIKEALRMNPPITTLADRVAAEDTEIAGTFIPKGTHVGLTAYELHHNPKVWKDPDTFDPERFAPGGEADQAKGLIWVPFGNGGERVCAGVKTSMTQQRVFLSMLLQKYKWYLPEDSVHKDGLITDGYGAPRPKDLKLVFEKRY